MTREQKIKNILEGTRRFLEEEKKCGTLTPEKGAAALHCQNSAIAALIES